MDTSTVTAQRGQGSAEFLLAAVPLLLIGLGGIEAVHWHFARQGVSLALSRAAREAVARNADPAALDTAFRAALLPLHAAPTEEESRNRLQRNMQRRSRDTGLPPWRILILSPSHASFRDFASRDPGLPQHAGAAVIDNDYVSEQHQARVAHGWAGGRGLASGQTALEVNILTLRLTWLHEPLLPGIRGLLRQLAPADARYGSLAMARGGYLPMQREISFVMQSHPIAWPMPPHGRVARASHPQETDVAFDAAGISDLPQEGETGRRGDDRVDGGDTAGPPAGNTQLPAFGGQPRCTGLWCIGYAGNEGRPEGGRDGPPGAGPVENAPPADQRGGEPDGLDGPPPAAPEDAAAAEDCPGCCD